MNSFLLHVARELYTYCQGVDMSRLTVVFPNKRAGLFLNQALTQVVAEQEREPRPILTPRYITISDLFLEHAAPFTVADPIEAVCALYEVYREVMGEDYVRRHDETLDRFYGWGEVMMADFNDIDKQMVDARSLFTNIKDLKELERFDYLSPEQEQVLRRYFKDFSIEGNEAAKERFRQLWDRMFDLYAAFRQRLSERHQLYDGALCRMVAERYSLRNDNRLVFRPIEGDSMAFVGFNMLPPVQERLLEAIAFDMGPKSLFFWDYDPSLSSIKQGVEHLFDESCLYIRSYLDRMPNRLRKGWMGLENERHSCAIDLIRTDTANAQVHYTPQWLQGKDPDRCAVVLADESLLPQVMGSLPAVDVNITMGYPLASTPVPGFVRALMDLQLKGRHPKKGFYDFFLQRLQRHPFHLYLAEAQYEPKPLAPAGEEPSAESMMEYLLDAIEVTLGAMPVRLLHQEGGEQPPISPYTLLNEEALYRVHEAISRLYMLKISDCGLACRLVERVMRSCSVPLHGVPVGGLQVMGILETRSLDFDHLLLLSAQDGILPRESSSNSLIPYCLRKPFGLSIEEEQVNVYAYNFFRMLCRAESASVLFSSGDRTHCEMSRFMRQLLAEEGVTVRDCSLDFSSPTPVEPPQAAVPDPQPNSPEAIRKLLQRPLSPTAIDTYLTCPMKFFYRYVKDIRVPEKVDTSLADNQLGSVFHRAAELLYTAIRHPETHRVTNRDLDVEPDLLERCIHQAFDEEVFQKNPDIVGFQGELNVARDVVRTYLLRLLELDRLRVPFIYVEGERQVSLTLPVGPHTVTIGGSIDRIDIVERHPLTGGPVMRVIDYKTGGKIEDKDFSKTTIENLFKVCGTPDERKHNVMQTFFYTLALNESTHHSPLTTNHSPLPLMPALIYIARASRTERYNECSLDSSGPVTDFSAYQESYRAALETFLSDTLLNPAAPYHRTPDSQSCKYCDYRLLCGLLSPTRKD